MANSSMIKTEVPIFRMTPSRLMGDSLLDRFFEQALSGTWTGGAEWPAATNVYETPNELVLEISVPGFSEDEVEVTLEGRTLTVKGTPAEQRADENRRYHLVEMRRSNFVRNFTLPSPVRGDDVKAEFSRGILSLILPKQEEARARKITIRGG